MALAKGALGFMLLTAALFQVSIGAVYKVGDSAGWTVGNIDYNNWASSKNFNPGDVMVFNYNNKLHDVEQVNFQEYQSCNATSSPIATYTTGSDSITLKSPGHYYYLCGIPGHCQAGQKVDIMVIPLSLRPIPSPAPVPSPNAPSPSPTPSPSPSPAPAPSGSSPSMAPTPSGNISSAPSPTMFTFWSALVTLAIFVNALTF